MDAVSTTDVAERSHENLEVGSGRPSGSPTAVSRSRKASSKVASARAASVTSFELPYSIDHGKEQSYAGGYKQFLPHSMRNIAAAAASQRQGFQLDALELSRDPLPFQRQHFKSSTILKMVHIPKRHQGMFADVSTFSLGSLRKKAMMLHSGRYQWDELLPEMRTLQLMSAALFGHPVRMMQREQQGMDLDEALRHRKREQELLPHRRQPHDLLLIGVQRLPYGDRPQLAHDMATAAVRGIELPRSSRPAHRIRVQAARTSPAISLPDPQRPSPPTVHRTAAAIAHLPRPAIAAGQRAQVKRSQGSGAKEQPEQGRLVPLRLPKIGSSRIITLVSAGPSVQSEVTRPRSADISTVSFYEPSAQDGDYGDDGGEANNEQNLHDEANVEIPEMVLGEEQPAFEISSGQLSRASERCHEDQTKFPQREDTPHPLRGADLSAYDLDQEELSKLFSRLDTDADGHLTFSQVRSHLASGLSLPQEKFVKLVYDITSAGTFFGVQEFIQLKCLCDEIKSHTKEVKESYGKLDFSVAKDIIMRSVELFDREVNRGASSHISIVALEDVVSIITNKERDKDFMAAFGRMSSALKLDTEFSKLNKIGFISLVPQFLQIEQFYDSNG